MSTVIHPSSEQAAQGRTRITLAQINPTMGDLAGNEQRIQACVKQARELRDDRARGTWHRAGSRPGPGARLGVAFL